MVLFFKNIITFSRNFITLFFISMKQIIFCASMLLAFASCTKPSTAVSENSDILRTGKWKMTAFTVKYLKDPMVPGVDSVYDIYKNMDTCRKDDYITFEENYVGIQYSGTKKCASELNEMPFDWKLSNNEKTLMMNNAQYTIGNTDKIPVTPIGKEYVEATITKMNKKSMTLTYQTTYNVLYQPVPLEKGTWVPVTFYFTQVFEK